MRQLSALHSALYFGADVAFNPSRDTKKQTQKRAKKESIQAATGAIRVTESSFRVKESSKDFKKASKKIKVYCYRNEERGIDADDFEGKMSAETAALF